MYSLQKKKNLLWKFLANPLGFHAEGLDSISDQRIKIPEATKWHSQEHKKIKRINKIYERLTE